MNARRKKPKLHITVSVNSETWDYLDNIAFERHCSLSNALEHCVRMAKVYENAIEEQRRTQRLNDTQTNLK